MAGSLPRNSKNLQWFILARLAGITRLAFLEWCYLSRRLAFPFHLPGDRPDHLQRESIPGDIRKAAKSSRPAEQGDGIGDGHLLKK